MGYDTASFPPTDWSLLKHLAGDDEAAIRQLSLDELLRRYLPPMRRFLLQRFRVDDDQASEWLQGFVTSKLLQSTLLCRADRDRGRFRSLLSHALTEYVIDQIRRARVRAVSLDNVRQAGGFDVAARADSDPAVMFDRHWAEHAIAEALERTRARLYESSRGPLWEVFQRRMLGSGRNKCRYRELANEFGFATPTQASTALNTAKRVFRRKLQDVLMEYAAGSSDLESAVQDLKNILRNSR